MGFMYNTIQYNTIQYNLYYVNSQILFVKLFLNKLLNIFIGKQLFATTRKVVA